jgi:hypothetical protein
MPVLNALGYNVFDPTEVVPEFTADVGTKKGEKVDYAIIINGQPMILVETKTAGSLLSINHASQLFRYFATTSARFAILTNGIQYQFFTDIEAANKMDEKPFFEFSMAQLDETLVAELKKFSKSQFDLEKILSNASELKYTKQVKKLIEGEVESPSEDFVRLFARQVYSGMLTQSIKEQFTHIVANAFRSLLKERINARIQSALDSTPNGKPEPADHAQPDDAPDPDKKNDIVTTEEEREAFYIVRGILAKRVHPSRIVMRDTKTYCGILLDDNNRKSICRLRFNFSKKYLSLINEDKSETRHPIADPVEIYQFEKELLAAIDFYEGVSAEPAAH